MFLLHCTLQVSHWLNKPLADHVPVAYPKWVNFQTFMSLFRIYGFLMLYRLDVDIMSRFDFEEYSAVELTYCTLQSDMTGKFLPVTNCTHL
ncbi:hypothetical protein PAXRUDRAFT_615809 [Paxillus rubicundulus Ve08.2h10]|uniref:Uncharacterized protein n=1 Tax=Paxillus rubicundulus Ve08.2h10 TaxID=930991 RepID=A0A0D0E3Q3_9AGAM|nr:hypothetical protein PAXRUDRAFT_615809 [Paxillus rubicundulus Ve08.2h10]